MSSETGLAAWEAGRAVWRKPAAEARAKIKSGEPLPWMSGPRTKPRFDAVLTMVTTVRPPPFSGNVNLADLIDVLTDVWDEEGV